MDLIWIFRWTGRRAQVGTDLKSRVWQESSCKPATTSLSPQDHRQSGAAMWAQGHVVPSCSMELSKVTCPHSEIRSKTVLRNVPPAWQRRADPSPLTPRRLATGSLRPAWFGTKTLFFQLLATLIGSKEFQIIFFKIYFIILGCARSSLLHWLFPGSGKWRLSWCVDFSLLGLVLWWRQALGTWAPSWYRGLVAPWHVGSSQARDRTSVPCIKGRFLTTRSPGKPYFI